jgi:hypothetical protein
MACLGETATMHRGLIAVILAVLPLTSARAQSPADDIGNNPFRLEDAIAAGRFALELRPRYNRIEETDKAEVTRGGTARAVAGWRSAPFEGFRAALEAIHTDTFAKDFNDNPALASDYPLLPDPRYTGLNQAYIDYASDALAVRAGRQVVRLDNGRWLSDNDFRQIPQLFEGFSARYAMPAGTELAGAYFDRQRTTSGDLRSLKLTLLHAAWNPVPGHAMAAYAIFHDQAQNGAFTGFADNSYKVAGARAEGAFAVRPWLQLPYTLEAAEQRPYANGDERIRASYWRAGAGAGSSAWTLRYDEERKGSNGGQYGLQMPLTDFYAFNGWTLHFFNTPRQGLRDRWLTGRYGVGDFTFYAEGHRFRSDVGNVDFGREVDMSVTYAWGEHLVARLQHARYDPGSGTPDPAIRKIWLTVSLAF